jgi:asparagine synthase (glutamine-hydrolysing)
VSGIAGVVRLDGAPAPAGAAAAMSAAQAHRGGDAEGVHADGPAELAATLRATTPEAVYERQPLVGASGIVLVADARLDNRGDLIASLTLRDRATLTDADIVLAAYEAWGAGTPSRLVGAFAFAAWDPGRRLLFCARDHLGLRPLCFAHRPGHLFAFASESKALFALDEVPRRVDERVLIEYLDGRHMRQGETFFEGVRRLPPAHHLTIDSAGLRLERYWRLDPLREVRLGGPGEHAEAFREQFDEAVRARLRTTRRVGSMLSGGLDSSSVAATARHLSGERIPTFSVTFTGVRGSDERPFQEQVVQGGEYEPAFIAGETLDPFAGLDRVLHLTDEPNGAANLFLNRAAWDAARSAGVDVVLDGFFGDSAVSYGDDRIAELLHGGRLVTWIREIMARARVEHGGRRMVRNLIVSSARSLLPQTLRTGTNDFADIASTPVFVPLSPPAAGRLVAHVPSDDDRFHTVRARQVEDIEHEAYTPLFEVMNKVAAGAGVDVRFPFADRRLLELCVAMPSEAKQRSGWDRWMLREAMTARLPGTIRWRTGKADLLPNLAQALRTTGRERLSNELDDPSGPLARFVDRNALADQLKRLDQGDLEAAGPLWAATCASTWLRNVSQNPTKSTTPTNSGPPAEA